MTTKTDEVAAARESVSGFRRGAATVYAYLAGLFVVGVLVQVFLAGVGVFGMHGTDAAHAGSFSPHRGWGTVLMVVAIVLLVVALLAWESAATVVGTVVLALLVVVAQVALASAGEHNKWVGGVHALNGIVILLLSGWLAWSARRRLAAHKSTSA